MSNWHRFGRKKTVDRSASSVACINKTITCNDTWFRKLSLDIFEIKSVRRVRWRYRILLLITVILIMLLLHKPILIAMGRYLELSTTLPPSDVVIVEGGNVVSRLHMEEAIRLLEAGTVERVIITLNLSDGKNDVFGLQRYDRVISSAMDSLRVSKNQYIIIPMEFKEPYTQNLAENLAIYCSEWEIQSAIVINETLHMRRSYLTYKKAFDKYDIKVYAHPIKIYVDSGNWWRSSNGARRVFGEYVKLTYYWLRGFLG